MTRTISNRTLESIYRINKAAKQQASLANDAYNAGRPRDAKKHSNRKAALYKTKAHAISRISDAATCVERHSIDDSNYYCLYFGDWSYHLPVDTPVLPVGESDVEATYALSDFETSHVPVETTLPLREALEHVESELNINANDFADPLPPTGTIGMPESVGWPFLPTTPRSSPTLAVGD